MRRFAACILVFPALALATCDDYCAANTADGWNPTAASYLADFEQPTGAFASLLTVYADDAEEFQTTAPTSQLNALATALGTASLNNGPAVLSDVAVVASQLPTADMAPLLSIIAQAESMQNPPAQKAASSRATAVRGALTTDLTLLAMAAGGIVVGLGGVIWGLCF